MAKNDEGQIAKVLLEHYGTTFAKEIGIPVEKNTPAPLFQLLVASLLFSARIAHENASQAARALIDAGLTTPKKMAVDSSFPKIPTSLRNSFPKSNSRTLSPRSCGSISTVPNRRSARRHEASPPIGTGAAARSELRGLVRFVHPPGSSCRIQHIQRRMRAPPKKMRRRAGESSFGDTELADGAERHR